MRYLLILLMLCSTTLASEWEFEFVQSTPQQSSSAVTYYTVMFTADWCTYCKVADREDLPKLLAAGLVTKKIDTDKKPEWKTKRKIRFKHGVEENQISSLPTFWLIQRDSTGTEFVVKEWKGRVGASVILNEVPNISEWSEPDVVVSVEKVSSPLVVAKTNYHVFSVYNGKPNNSHTNRQSLINHLSMDGIHRGKHSISYLNSLSDIELDNLHSLDHNNH